MKEQGGPSARGEAGTPGEVLSLGSNVVELLLPQRWPMLMVDRIERFFEHPRPTIEASRFISASDVVFRGHFPGLHLWPGTLTIEGMGQAGAALAALVHIRERFTLETGDSQAAFEALRNLERGYRMHPGYNAQHAERFRLAMRNANSGVAVGAAVDVKLRRPVFAGQRLDYRVEIAHQVGEMVWFQVEASVGGTVVADGTMLGARFRQMFAPNDGE